MTVRRGAAFISLVLVVALASAVLVTRNTRKDPQTVSSPGPGFSRQEREVSNAPFALAAPSTTAGPTTLPGGVVRSNRTTTTDTTSTTTTLPASPLVRPVNQIESICGMTLSLASMERIFTDPSIDVQETAELFFSNMNRYVEVSPPAITGDVTGLRDSLAQVVRALQSSAWEPSAPAVAQTMAAIRAAAPPFAAWEEQLRRVTFFEQTQC